MEAPSNKNQRTILIVEDDAEVRDLAVTMFESEGYTVLTAENAVIGLETFKSNPEIDLVFTDVIMPGGVTGVEMTKRILELRPDALVLLASGYQDKGAALIDSTYNMDNIAYVDKPYDVDEIPGIVASMFDNAEASSA
ncbi:MAG: response regulator [Pseudomonadales bacterium]|nr:response regulator [Pseudomonadales bacterium]